ncbi:MAG TPA: SUF system NifU family Fe-S cluster assembly protein [Flexilinea sp.]|jgi:nitrogen fixation NifU-like protein|nr:SUF system NifU family Fe-S cluster assembly protein [Flexilinea sp.]OQA28557.1 MAG: NifU-like protein [Chloroflexi bacterium ADurb.Bin344]HNY19166.1 SUF system NifU family Fe-S cluster assembly protein [Flexilinea sp.]HOG22417.1 SUF system NifU family Fe-S cluster assembly protein [Flexilinea sp.]HOG60825.1 SUF system NifU family Fe-S cluster assembly protein [Flexilinea sp.]
MDDLYRENILDHYKNPIYKGTLEPADLSFEDENPLCGDHLRIDLRVDEKGNVTDARFSGHGCAISQASADLLLESIIGKNIEDLKKLTKEDILDLLGIEELGPVRLKCALLSLKVLKGSLYGIGQKDEDL